MMLERACAAVASTHARLQEAPFSSHVMFPHVPFWSCCVEGPVRFSISSLAWTSHGNGALQRSSKPLVFTAMNSVVSSLLLHEQSSLDVAPQDGGKEFGGQGAHTNEVAFTIG